MDAVGTWFEFSVVEFEAAYKAAMCAIEERYAASEQRMRAYYAIDADSEVGSVGHDDSDGSHFDFWAEVGDEERGVRRAAETIRLSFAIGLFQLFERHASKWVAITKGEEHLPAVETYLRDRGHHPDMETVRELKLVANTLKHGSGPSASRLFQLNPTMFDQEGMTTSADFIPSDQNLIVTDGDLGRYFFAIKNLGPRARRPWDLSAMVL